jgi:hypothetical protein
VSREQTKLRSAVVEEFYPQFAPNAKLIFLRGTTKKPLLFDETPFTKLGISVLQQANFPDVILYDPKKKWLFLIEAATVSDFISPKRYSEFSKIFEKYKAGRVYVTAFLDFATYKKYANNIAWETEVWIAETPSHMIHLNGDKFF